MSTTAANIVLAKAGGQLHLTHNTKLARLRQYFSVSGNRTSLRMKFYLVGISILLCISCDFNKTKSHDLSADSVVQQEENIIELTSTDLKENVVGSWIAQTEEGDTLYLSKDSIFSFEWIIAASYTIDSSRISIGDGAYYNKFFLIQNVDTLVFIDQDGKERKYTRSKGKD